MVVGAGPAGLTAAWQLARRGVEALVLEADGEHVGGLARTMSLDGHRYDVGPHRFYTKSAAVRRMWERMLPAGFVEVERLTRIFYDKHFFPYPLSLRATLDGIGWRRAARAGLSWGWAQARPRRPERSFEDWVVNRFGWRLYSTFFKTYTEKVWGVPCAEINKDWAAQRIRGLSLPRLLQAALWPRRHGVTSLIDRFLYPRRGAGQLWEAVRDEVVQRGGRVELGSPVTRLLHDGDRIRAAVGPDGRVHEGDHFHLTLTLADFVRALDPAPPREILAAGTALGHRDFMTVALIVPREGLFPDQWIYVHDPGVQVARITNYASWNADMSPDDRTTALGMEYFCTRGDETWARDDQAMLAHAASELERIGLLPAAAVVNGRVHRFLDAYPVYDERYLAHRETLKTWIGATFRNAGPAGRKGLHNYNSQDHAMMSASLSVRNALDGAGFDVWSINTEAEYAEEGEARPDIEERLVPRRLPAAEGGS